MSIRGAVLFRSWASSWVALGCLLGGRVRSGPVDGSWLRKKALPCSVALVLFKNKRSHAAWRSFCIFRLGRRRLAAGLGRTSANPLRLQRKYHFSKKMRSHAAWRSKCSASLWHPRSPVLCFPVSGAWPFLSCCSFGALALCFPILRGHPFHHLKSRFSVLALWRFICRSAALSFFDLGRPLGWPWVAFWAAGSGRARLMRSHAAWHSFLVFPKRSHAAWRSFSVSRSRGNVVKIKVLERGARLGGPQGILRGRLFGHLFALSTPKQIFPDLHMIRVKPIAAFNKMVSSERGSLEEGSGDASLPCPSKTNFLDSNIFHLERLQF